MVKLKRLKIHQYRNVRPGTELHFDDGVNLVLGQNGAGKTTLLGLISAASRSAFIELANEEFEIEYDLQCDDNFIRAKASHRRQPNPVAPGMFPVEHLWSDDYSIEISDATGQPLHSLAFNNPSESTSRSTTPLMLGWSFIVAALMGRVDSFFGVIRDLSSGASAFRFDESLDCFAAATGRPPVLESPALPKPARLAWREKPVSIEVTYVPEPLGLKILNEFFRTGERPASLGGADEDFAKRVAQILRVSEVSLEPNVQSWQNTKGEKSLLIEGFTFWVTRVDGTRIHHDLLSYGQKRLLAFFFYLAQNPSIVIADELVNGLHHRWIEACMAAIGERQAFLTSQNPLLFEYVRFESIEQVQSAFITCKTEIIDGAEQLVWQNMPREDAISFFRGYEADIESVGDILINRGLW